MVGLFVWMKQERVDAPEEVSRLANEVAADSVDQGGEVGEVTPEVKTKCRENGFFFYVFLIPPMFLICRSRIVPGGGGYGGDRSYGDRSYGDRSFGGGDRSFGGSGGGGGYRSGGYSSGGYRDNR